MHRKPHVAVTPHGGHGFGFVGFQGTGGGRKGDFAGGHGFKQRVFVGVADYGACGIQRGQRGFNGDIQFRFFVDKRPHFAVINIAAGLADHCR